LRLIRFSKLVGSTAADVIFNFAPRSVNDLINKNLELEPLALVIGLRDDLSVVAQGIDLVFCEMKISQPPSILRPNLRMSKANAARGFWLIANLLDDANDLSANQEDGCEENRWVP